MDTKRFNADAAAAVAAFNKAQRIHELERELAQLRGESFGHNREARRALRKDRRSFKPVSSVPKRRGR